MALACRLQRLKRGLLYTRSVGRVGGYHSGPPGLEWSASRCVKLTRTIGSGVSRSQSLNYPKLNEILPTVQVGDGARYALPLGLVLVRVARAGHFCKFAERRCLGRLATGQSLVPPRVDRASRYSGLVPTATGPAGLRGVVGRSRWPMESVPWRRARVYSKGCICIVIGDVADPNGFKGCRNRALLAGPTLFP